MNVFCNKSLSFITIFRNYERILDYNEVICFNANSLKHRQLIIIDKTWVIFLIDLTFIILKIKTFLAKTWT